MNFPEIEKVIEEAGFSVCPICGTPFKKYHSRQKTCGAPDCKREFHNQYVREYTKRRKEEDPIAFAKMKAAANRRWRDKLKAVEEREEQLTELQEKWEHTQEFDKFVSEHGHEYGKYSAEKVLATVPKIDVNLEKK